MPPQQTTACRHLILRARPMGAMAAMVADPQEEGCSRLCLPCSYRNLATEHEALMQKYLHLLQIVETEKTVAKQLRQQIEDGEIEIERLKAEVKSPASPCGCAAAPQGDLWAVGGQVALLLWQGPGDVAASVFMLVLTTSGWPLLLRRGARASPLLEVFLAGAMQRAAAAALPRHGACARLGVVLGPGTLLQQGRVCSSNERWGTG